jgi:hypothetical protein
MPGATLSKRSGEEEALAAVELPSLDDELAPRLARLDVAASVAVRR